VIISPYTFSSTRLETKDRRDAERGSFGSAQIPGRRADSSHVSVPFQPRCDAVIVIAGLMSGAADLSYQWSLARLPWRILAAVLGLVLALSITGGSQLGGFAGHGVLAGGATSGGPSPPPHPNV
jgi:hypothetical protein